MIDEAKTIKRIKIEDGDVFDGTPKDFAFMTFLPSVTHDAVINWARQYGYRNVEIKYGKAPVRRVQHEAEGD